MKALCVTAEVMLSPKIEDRFCRFRFIPNDPTPAPAKGLVSTDSSLWVCGDAGDFQIGKEYEVSITVKEA